MHFVDASIKKTKTRFRKMDCILQLSVGSACTQKEFKFENIILVQF